MTEPRLVVGEGYFSIIKELEREFIVPGEEAGLLKRWKKSGEIRADIDKTLRSMVDRPLPLEKWKLEGDFEYDVDLYAGDICMPKGLGDVVGVKEGPEISIEKDNPMVYVFPMVGEIMLPPVFRGKVRHIYARQEEPKFTRDTVSVSPDFYKAIKNGIWKYLKGEEPMTGICFSMCRYDIMPTVSFQPVL
ncbi:MAG: hypothetical protein V3V26_02970 [Candidatus Aenigmarchaeota archaeon]